MAGQGVELLRSLRIDSPDPCEVLLRCPSLSETAVFQRQPGLPGKRLELTKTLEREEDVPGAVVVEFGVEQGRVNPHSLEDDL
uniref:hypothetical protein n=1 Tax=Amycolatopsis sp. CA-293810 TaxID=3239926 RepID=UPI003F49A724